ncbi:hypothetical protein MtrunA17_Chr7g0242531 [Medicago truncatula]|uniref:Transmembrane protein n=1 Tax=Medicago truncatula TaxID=3880 RepID=A0A396H141_MEDTR|nr:hypothetical protein MtrunA17_Chr7g0242531 [Medicago truncatula]
MLGVLVLEFRFLLFHLLVAFVGVWYLKYICIDLHVSLLFCSSACQIELTVHDSCGYEVALLIADQSLWVVVVGGAIVFFGPLGGCGGATGGFDVWFGGDGVEGWHGCLFTPATNAFYLS